MTNKELAAALRLCGSTPTSYRCKERCPFHKGNDMTQCILAMTAACADALENHESHVLALQKEIEGLRGQLEVERRPQWVSVSERLPECDAVCVMALVSGKWRNIELHRAHEIATYSKEDGWILETWPEWENPDVTHWMPIPEPPKEAKEDG